MDHLTRPLDARSLAATFDQKDFTQKSLGFAALEEAMAFERLRCSFELLAEALRETPWVSSLSVQWRGGSTCFFKIAPLSMDSPLDTHRPHASLGAIMDFAIMADRMSRGALDSTDLASSRGLMETLAQAVAFGAKTPSFNGASALNFKTKLRLAERELSKALVWSAKAQPAWLPPRALESSWEKSIERSDSLCAQELSGAFGFKELGAQIERLTLAQAAPSPFHPAPTPARLAL